jgi:hypothetical protein
VEDQAASPRVADSTETGPDRSRFPRLLRKTGTGILGGAVTTAGIVMLVTPGPGIIVTLAGLGILGREFPLAQRGLDRIRAYGPDRTRTRHRDS